MELFEKYSSIDPLISISAFDLLMRGYYLINPSEDIMSINDDNDDNVDNDNEYIHSYSFCYFVMCT